MTKIELIQMTGSEEQATYAMHILLNNVKPEFVRMAIKAELASINNEIVGLEAEGYICRANGDYHVNWCKAEHLNGWHLTAEQEAAYEAAYAKCQQADHLLYRRNRTASLLAVRV